MTEKDPLLDGPGIHLSIFAEVYNGLREPIGLPARVEAVYVGLVLLSTNVRVQDRRQHKQENRAEQKHEREDRGIADAPNLPASTPASQRPFERPTQEGERGDDDDEKECAVLVDMMQNIVAHFVAHHCLDFRRRPAAQEVV